jgi:RND family efflux transporter MFP subunit
MPVGVVGDGGTVVRVLVNAGDRVRAGQLLALIDRQVQSQQQATSAANVAVTQADARIAQANLDRGMKLVSNGFISNADIDKLTAVRDAAAARVRVAQAQLGEVGARMRRLNIVAPADGLLLDRAVEPGQVVSPGSGVLFRVAEKGAMELKARLSEGDLQKLAVGQQVQVTPVGSDKVFAGTVWQISPIIDPATRQGTARIALPFAPDIRPGGFASAAIVSGMVSAPLLPESALQADSQGSYVYVVGKDNKATRRRVKIAMVTEKGVAIGQGLSGQERVVLRAGAFLSEGETVQPRNAANK